MEMAIISMLYNQDSKYRHTETKGEIVHRDVYIAYFKDPPDGKMAQTKPTKKSAMLARLIRISTPKIIALKNIIDRKRISTILPFISRKDAQK